MHHELPSHLGVIVVRLHVQGLDSPPYTASEGILFFFYCVGCFIVETDPPPGLARCDRASTLKLRPPTPPPVVTWGAGSRHGGTPLHTLTYVRVWFGGSTEMGGTGSSGDKRLRISLVSYFLLSSPVG